MERDKDMMRYTIKAAEREGKRHTVIKKSGNDYIDDELMEELQKNGYKTAENEKVIAVSW